MEGSRRRSAMANVAVNGSQGAVPRSGLSNVMYPAAHANPMVATQRSSSYQSPQQWQYQYHKMSTGVVYSVPDPPHVPEVPRIPSLKGKEIERGPTPGSARAPSLQWDKGSNLVVSSSNSITSRDGIEIKHLEHPSPVTVSTAPSSVVTAPTDAVPVHDGLHSFSSRVTGTHRLHPSRQRRLSDASIEKPLSGSQKQPRPRSSRDPGPPPSTRGFNSIPTVPSIPPLPQPTEASHGLHDYSNMASSSSSLASSESSSSILKTTSYHSHKTPNSSVSSTGSSASYKAPQPRSVSPLAASEFVFPFSNESTSAVEPDSTLVGAVTPAQKVDAKEPEQSITPKAGPPQPETRARLYQPPNPQSLLPTSKPTKSYYSPKVTRFTENVVEVPPEPQPRAVRPTNWLTRRFSQSSRLSVDDVPEPQPAEPGSIAEAAERASGKKRLSKTKPAKLLKKNRWSIGSRAR